MSDHLLKELDRIATAAGEKILSIYNSPFEVQQKWDGSLVTDADRTADDFIHEELTKLDGAIPIVTEEQEKLPFEERSSWSEYFLVDPLDGTRSFVKREGQFTVNIALIRDTEPILGVVRAPLRQVSYGGDAKGHKAWRKTKADLEPTSIQCRPLERNPLTRNPLTVLASKNHRTPADNRFLDRLRRQFAGMQFESDSSSLKFCIIAEGKADLYSRFQHTSEWDIGAAHAVLSAAGGDIFQSNGEPFRYNLKASMLNDYFFAVGDTREDWLEFLVTEFNRDNPD